MKATIGRFAATTALGAAGWMAASQVSFTLGAAAVGAGCVCAYILGMHDGMRWLLAAALVVAGAALFTTQVLEGSDERAGASNATTTQAPADCPGLNEQVGEYLPPGCDNGLSGLPFLALALVLVPGAAGLHKARTGVSDARGVDDPWQTEADRDHGND